MLPSLARFLRPKVLEQFVNEFGYHPIRLQDRVGNRIIQCNICYRLCRISTYDFGACNAVFNAGDDLISTTYGMLIRNPDKENIETLGFLHYQPGTTVLCPFNLHCNFGCVFCFAAEWSQTKPKFYITETFLSPREVVEKAKEQAVDGIGFGMTEPTLLLDFILDTAILAKQAGLYVTMNSNGYMTPEAIELLAPVIDAVSISVKGMGDSRIYNKWLLTGSADPIHVLESIKLFYEQGVHVEVTGLYSHQDCHVETNPRNLSSWLATNVDRQLPFVLLPLRPWKLKYRADLHDISNNDTNRIKTLCRQSGLHHVYNIVRSVKSEPPDILTLCPNCRTVVVRRKGHIKRSLELSYSDVRVVGLTYIPDVCGLNVIDGKGYCKQCNTKIYGIW